MLILTYSGFYKQLAFLFYEIRHITKKMRTKLPSSMKKTYVMRKTFQQKMEMRMRMMKTRKSKGKEWLVLCTICPVGFLYDKLHFYAHCASWMYRCIAANSLNELWLLTSICCSGLSFSLLPQYTCTCSLENGEFTCSTLVNKCKNKISSSSSALQNKCQEWILGWKRRCLYITWRTGWKHWVNY